MASSGLRLCPDCPALGLLHSKTCVNCLLGAAWNEQRLGYGIELVECGSELISLAPQLIEPNWLLSAAMRLRSCATSTGSNWPNKF